MNKLQQLIRDPKCILLHLNAKGYFKILPDSMAIKLIYLGAFGKRLNLKNPKTFNEKLQWLKIYNRNPLYTKMVDKYEVKQYLQQMIDSCYLIPTLGVWEHFDEIDFSSLPNRFVLKTTHDSGGVVICTDRSKFKPLEAREKLEYRLSKSWYERNREWPYKNVKPRIIAEPYMEDKKTHDLRDYKFFCFDGIPRAMFVATDRQNSEEETKFDFFDMDFKHLDLRNIHPNADVLPEKPANFALMKKICTNITKGIPCVRVDFYESDGKVYVGELTFFHQSGLAKFDPEDWDYKLGEWIKLPQKRK